MNREQSWDEDVEPEGNLELSASNTGPKGVINDWRKFKLESEDHEISSDKKQLLRQLSSPYRSFSKEDKDTRKKFSRKMSVQEYEMIQDEEDETCLRRYRKQCMQEMHQQLSFGPQFGMLYELESGEQFLEVIEKELKKTTVMVNVYEDRVKGCESLNNCLTCLALEYPLVKFCKIKASNTGTSDRFSDNILPALLVYKAGELIGNFLHITEQLGEEFFAVDLETFLNEYGLLPEREFTACENASDGSDVDIE
ncbi:phosducin-like isoform X2 [Hypanus sabinus]|uniref:phosducin-like isoform X2 n=1 Tax=Hypanus sabinus TaxID=79690 RepID=UPI0028C45AF7|nr:phosducin-like isoform X2 [Hypanus sabinus]XP_059840446.1 phosducin-like isoform X2 [Hypanus sabinus]XP_059840447.1 phosducin-like isoform X2 [Hypanus sabinus]XP_059840448.1 phosducin-like isoform X2 [Hypanus sabinus]XP_059840449.1 phosducin-like isoform X2 [Hypanus sabinus]XP_059840450.1 phosducin-like isoform X2 [Hypanus sabinus]